MVALRHLSTTCLAFEDASAVWCTATLQIGFVFQGKTLDGSSGKIYLSLGFHFAATLLWEVQEVQDGIFEIAPSEDFWGIPTTICPLMLVASVFYFPTEIICFFFPP